MIPSSPRERASLRRGAGRRPMHPGVFLETRFLQPLKLSQQDLADAIGVSRRRINEIVNGRRGVTADTALRLGLYFKTEPEMWLRMQVAYDMHDARQLLMKSS
jgi:addiction module HigA family antidote